MLLANLSILLPERPIRPIWGASGTMPSLLTGPTLKARAAWLATRPLSPAMSVFPIFLHPAQISDVLLAGSHYFHNSLCIQPGWDIYIGRIALR